MKMKLLIPLLLLGVFVLWVVSGMVTLVFLNDWNQRAEFGDMFGAVNALFSGLAFAGVIITVLMQREELKLQREDLEQTREELRGQKEQLQAQNNTLQQQQFSSTFFQLFRIYEERVDRLSIAPEQLSHSKLDRTTEGRKCFSLVYTEIEKDERSCRNARAYDYSEKGIRDYRECMTDICSSDIEGNIPEQYLRSVYYILRFTDEAQIDNESKGLYISIATAAMTSSELMILNYYLLFVDAIAKDFFSLAIKWKLLGNLPIQDLIWPSIDENLFNAKIERELV